MNRYPIPAQETRIEITVVNSRFAKPLDTSLILDLAGRHRRIITVEENVLSGGFGSNVVELLHTSGRHDIQLHTIGLPDEFVEHGTQSILRAKYGLDADGIARQAAGMFAENCYNNMIGQGKGKKAGA